MGTMAVERRWPYKRYSAEFKREQIERVLRGEITAAELSRELGIARSQLPPRGACRRSSGRLRRGVRSQPD